MRASVLMAGLWLALGATGSIQAAEVTVPFLTPESYQCEKGAKLPVYLEAGTPASPHRIPWDVERIEWVSIRSEGGEERRHEFQPSGADKLAIPFVIEHPGAALIAMQFKESRVEMSSVEFTDFVTNRATVRNTRLQAAARSDQRPRVRRYETASLVVRTRGSEPATGPSPITQGKAGLTVELQPLADPTSAKVGSELPLRLIAPKVAPLEGAVVRATHVPSGKTQVCPLDRVGNASVKIDGPGVWRLEYNGARMATKNPAFDWVIYTATLSFEVPGDGAATSQPTTQAAAASQPAQGSPQTP